MFNPLTKPSKKSPLYLLLGFLALTLLLIHLSLRHQPPKLTTTYPLPDSTKVSLFSPIILTFSKPTQLNDVSLTSSPSEVFIPSQPQPNLIKFDHQLAFYQNKTYTIHVYYHQKLISTFQFTTQKSQNEPRQLQLLEQETQRDYPLAKFTPYTTNQFEVVYTAPKTLQITLKQPHLDRQLILNQIKAWVKNHDQDPNSHQYIFKQLTPYRSTI